jgi:hypothetical protein
VVNIVVSRGLGPENRGVFFLAFAAALVIAMVGDLGMSTAGIAYAIAATIVGTAASRAVERERVNRCLASRVSMVHAWRRRAALGAGPRRAPPGRGRRGRRSRPAHTTRHCRWSMSSSR